MTEKKKLIRTATEEEIIEKTLPMFGVEGNWEEITEQPNSSYSVIYRGRDGIKLSVAKLGLTRFTVSNADQNRSAMLRTKD